MRFQRSLDNFPKIKDRQKYKELRMLIEKYERNELSSIIFALSDYAGMSVDEARNFVRQREAEYEAK